MRYANPFRFFLSVSIIFFLFNSFLNYFKADDSEPKINLFINSRTSAPATNYNIVGEDTLKTDGNIQQDQNVDYEYIAPQNLDTSNFFNKNAQKAELFYQFYKTNGIADPRQAMESLHYDQSDYNLWLYSKNKMIDPVKETPTPLLTTYAQKFRFSCFLHPVVLTFLSLDLFQMVSI